MKVFKRSLAMLLCLAMTLGLFAGLTLTASAATQTLSFSFTSCPSGWPSGSSSSANTKTYTVDGTAYTFSLGANVYYNTSKYLMLKSTTYLGLPAIDGYKLTKVVAGNSSGCSKSTKVSVCTNTSGTAVTGGTAQTWSSQSSSYTYNLSNTSANTMYYLYITSANCQIVSLDLTYESTAPSKTLSSIAVSSNHRTFTVGDTFVKETVTATYSDSSTADVTSSATFSSPSMSTAGTKTINVSYTEGGTTKSTSYTINVVAPTPYTLTYSVNGDTSVISSGSYTSGSSVSLPANVTAPAGYTFAGWTTGAIASETTTAPAVLTGSYSMPAANTTLYAVYTRTEGGSGGSSNTYTLTDNLVDGDYMFGATYDGDVVVPNTTLTSGWLKYDSFTPSNGVITNTNSLYVWTLTNQAGGGFTLKNKSTGAYFYVKSSTGSGTVTTDSSSHTVYATVAVAGDKSFEIHDSSSATTSSGNQVTFNYNGGSGGYRNYAERTTSDSMPNQFRFFKGGAASTTYYTTTVNTAATYYTLTYSVNPASSGSIDCEIANNGQVEEDTDVTLTATAAEHFTFKNWTVSGTDEYVEDGNELLVTMTDDVTVIANFEAEPTYTVTITPAAGGTMTASKTSGIYAGETITLTATPNAHYSFNGWQCTAGGASISGNSFTMPAANVTVTGSFTEATKYTVTFYASSLPADTGSALSTQSVYGGECATAPTPDSKDGFTFLGWYTAAGTWSTNPGVIKSATIDSTAVNANVTYYGVWAEGTGAGDTFKLVVDGKYVGERVYTTKWQPYLESVSSEADAAEFGIDEGGYLYYMDEGEKYYVSNKSNATDLSFSYNKSDATPWTVNETASGISFTTTAAGERELAHNNQSPRFAAYQGNADNYPYIFTKIGGTAVSEYTTAPVQTASHTVYWHNGDTYTTTSVKEGTAITAPEEDPTKADSQETYYTFAGWSATEGGSVVSSYGNMGTSDKHFYAIYTPATYSFTASIVGADTVRVDRSKTLTGSLIASPAKDTSDYTVTWSSSDSSKVTVDANGRITGVAEGTAVITATFTLLDGTTKTATKTITVTGSSSGASGYTLITQDNEPEDWSGDYIIMGKIGGDTDYMNTWMILTPDYDGSEVAIATNNEDAATITITDDGDGVGTGTINDEGNASSGVVKTIEMEDTGLVTDTYGDDSILVYDTITSIDDHYAFTIECIDDVNQIYTIRVKDTNLYISCSANTSTGSNTLEFDSAATERAQWQFSVQRVTKGGYNNDIIVAQNIGNSTRRLYFNSNSYGATNGQFRDYHSGAYGSMIGGNATGEGQTYNLYLFGNPNPFKAQIYYKGDQITLVDTGKVSQNSLTAQLTSALVPDIDNYPNWTQVGDPSWEIVENSTGNHMTIDSETGLITTNSSSVGSYALVKVTYTVHDEINNVNKLVSTTSKVEVVASTSDYYTVIYEQYSGSDTEVQYTIPNSVTELPLAAYVVNESTSDNSKTGDTVMGGTLTWTITSTSTSMFGTFSIGADGILHVSNVTKDSILTIKVTGATGDGISAADATYKVYITVPTYTVNIVPTPDSAGTHDTTTDTLTVPGTATGAHLTYEVEDGNGNGPSSSTFSTAGYAWTISGDAQGALINSNGVLDFSEMDRSEDHTITVVVSRIAAIDAATGVVSSGLTDTITVVVKAQPREDFMTAVDDLVIVDYALPVTFNVLTNDNINVEVEVTAGTLPSGVVNNGNGSFTFTPSGWLTADQTFDYTIAGTVNGSAATDTATVTLKTADSVYYEDTYSGIFTFTGNWTDLTDGTAIAEQTSSLDTADIFEYDANYEAYAQYSGGTAKTTTVVKGNASRPSVSFTFAGTGFDVISATTNNGGALLMTIKDAGGNNVTDPVTGRNLNAIYDNFRGYVYCEEEYTRYTLDQVKRGDWNGSEFKANPLGDYYYDRDNNEYTTPVNGKWYSLPYDDTIGSGKPGATGTDGINLYDCYTIEEAETFFASYEDEAGNYIIKEHQSHWLPYDKAGEDADTFNQNFYQIPIMKITGLPYGTYTVTLSPTYSSAYDRAGDESYDFIFDGVRIHNPVANRDAEYKYINIADAVDEEGMGSGVIVTCDHVGYEWSDWTFYSRARNTNSATTCNRGSFVQYCSYCGGVANTAYFHVNVTADDTDLGVGGYMGYPSTTMLRYTLTADECENQAAIQAKLDALTGSLTEYWSSNTRAIMTCMNNSNVVIASGEGTTYATLQLKDPITQTIYASAIHSPMITVYADEDHVHTFGDWTHDTDSDPSTHTHTCTGENCSFYETEECVFTEEVTLEPTQTTPGSKTCTCALCGYSYIEEIPALGGHTATFIVPEGATAPAAQTGNSVTMPKAVAAPADYDAHNYTFVGWVGTSVSDTTAEPEFYTPNFDLDLDEDMVFYALYTYGGTAGGYTLASAVPEVGDEIIIAFKDGDDYYALPNGNADSGTSIAAESLTVTNGEATATSDVTFELVDKEGDLGIKSTEGGYYLGFNSNKISMNGWGDTKHAEITAASNGMFLISSAENAPRGLSYSGSSFKVSNEGGSPVYIFSAAGATYYTTNLAATCKHTDTTTTTVDATCTEAGSETVTCNDCGETVSTTVLPALGHDYQITSADATGTTYTCSRCGDSYFEPAEFEVTYVLQPGVIVSGNSREGNAITLPNAASIPATYNAHDDYELVGWKTSTGSDTETNPSTYAKGATVTVTEDTTFYPVYKFTESTGGGSTEPGDYKLVTSALAADAWEGKYLIAYSDTVFMDGGLSGKNAGNAQTHVSPGSALSNNTVTKAWGDQHYLELEAITDGGSTYVLKTSNGTYIYQTTNKNGIAESANKNTAASYPITVNFQSSSDVRLALGGAASGAVLRYNSNAGTSGEMFRFYKDCGQKAVYLYKQEMTPGSGSTTTTYTFELKAAADSYSVTLNPATLTMYVDTSASVTATLYNNGAVAAAEDISFSSSNDNIVMVDENTGYVLAGETAGTATITVEVLAADGEVYTATCAVTVKEQSNDLTVNYIGSASGNVYNWGTRGTTATFLTEMADNYYTGSYSYDTLSALSGDNGTGTGFYTSALGTAIHNMLVSKQKTTTSYDGTKTLYAYTDCVESDTAHISSYYSAVQLTSSWDGAATWNREHTWPKSKALSGTQGDQNDIMMLRPTSVNENGDRSNLAYGESSGYYDPNSEGQNLHGDVARLMLQHLMRWGNTSKFYGTGGVMESRAILLKWLAEDPVDTWELGRNDAVERITGVRNVFVDYPELAFILLGAEVPANYTTPSASGIVAEATYSATRPSNYEPVTEAAATKSLAPAATEEEAPATKGATRSIAAGTFNGIAIIDGKGASNVADDQAAYGPEHGVYLAPGQGIVFSLVSDVAITSQDLQIGAKAVNGTATAIDVASISNGTESTGIKYLLENKAIASATEMYYELDTTQMGWNGTESSVLVVYNSGEGVLDVTNIRYSTVNGNTLTLRINEAEVQKAIKMIQIVYGEPITDPDPIEPTDLDLNFKSAELVLNSDIAINFNVEEAVMDSADGVYAVFTKALYNEVGEITGYAESTVSEAIYNEETGLYSFRFTGINPAEMGSAVTATLYGYRGGELVSGETVNYSVLTYINNMYGKVETAEFRTLLADLAAYGEAAQNYVSYNTANLVTADVVDGLMAYATKAAPELNNATAITGEGAVKFTGAYLSLREKITVCYVIDASEYSGNVADLELRIFDGSRQIGTAAFKNVNGKYVASFSDLNALQMRTVLTAEVYEGDTCVSTTLDYSIESYAASKAAGSDTLADLVNAMMNFGISAETYFN